MPGDSRIEWTDATWNPVTGCTKVSAGCDHCYAETFAERFRGVPGHPYEQGFDLKLWAERLEIPLRWRKPRRIFVNSMSDLFHADVPTEFIDQVFGVMAAASRHTFQILTKRPRRMERYLNDPETKRRIWHAGRPIVELTMHREMYDVVPIPLEGRAKGPDWCYPAEWPLPNVWIGTSVENQEAAFRIDFLIQTPAIVRFLSCEPLIDRLSIEPWLWLIGPSTAGPWTDALGRRRGGGGAGGSMVSHKPANDLHWVIVGGESGPGHRPCDKRWVEDLRDQCVDAGVPFFFKQWGGIRSKAGGRELDGRTWDQMPAQGLRLTCPGCGTVTDRLAVCDQCKAGMAAVVS